MAGLPLFLLWWVLAARRSISFFLTHVARNQGQKRNQKPHREHTTHMLTHSLTHPRTCPLPATIHLRGGALLPP
jgi:hypothetical protein